MEVENTPDVSDDLLKSQLKDCSEVFFSEVYVPCTEVPRRIN